MSTLLGLAVIFLPPQYENERQRCESDGTLERTDLAKDVLQNLGEYPRENGSGTVSDGALRMMARWRKRTKIMNDNKDNDWQCITAG